MNECEKVNLLKSLKFVEKILMIIRNRQVSRKVKVLCAIINLLSRLFLTSNFKITVKRLHFHSPRPCISLAFFHIDDQRGNYLFSLTSFRFFFEIKAKC